MIYSDDVKRKHKGYNANQPKIPDHPHRILIIGGSGSGKTNALLNLISHQPDIGEIYLYANDWYEAKYQLLITKPEGIDLKYCNDSKASIEYSNDVDVIYENIGEQLVNSKQGI